MRQKEREDKRSLFLVSSYDMGKGGIPTGLEAAELFIAALGVVALGNNGGDVAAGLGVAVLGGDGRHCAIVLLKVQLAVEKGMVGCGI